MTRRLHFSGKTSRWVLPVACLVGLAGCAPLPAMNAPAEPKNIGQLSSSQSFAEPATSWPRTDWWKTYGDAQLDTLIEEALRDSPNLAIAEARMRQAGAMTQVAGAPLLPEVTGNASFTQEKQSYNYLSPREATPKNWNDYGRATLNLSWELDFWGKNRSAFSAALSEHQAMQAEVAQTRLIVSASVASAYAELLHLFTIRDSAQAALSIRATTVDLFRQRHDFGLENLASVRQVEAKMASALAELLTIDERIALQRNAVAALLGAGPDRGLAITRPVVRFTAGPGLPPNLALELLGRRPDIVAARLRTEAAAKRIDQRKADFYPSVNLLAFAGFHSLGIDNLTRSGSDIGSFGPAISLPIFNTERLQGELRGARAEYDGAVFTYNAALSNALREVADAVTGRKSLEGELSASRSAVASASEAHRIVSKRYQGQLATYLDVLSAEDTLISAQRALADIETRALQIDVALTRALGGGFQDPGTGNKKPGGPA